MEVASGGSQERKGRFPREEGAVTIKTPPVSQHSGEVLHPYPRAQATAALKAENEALWAEDVAADRLEYSHVLVQFRAIEAELPEVPLEDVITQFHLALSKADSYREVAIWQKQKLSELREQVDKERKRSFEAHEKLDAANARAIHLRDHLEELEESVHSYWTWAHVVEELIRKYPEDEGLYEVDLPLFSSL
ncbi:MAG: hypothetical protein NXY57DRAFT_966896 [Lentinula lateritia]|nr:MAG: hypothetical protein NXY57DRAFT_966896 [Lentinula lateritia]